MSTQQYLNFQEVCELLKITSHHLRQLVFKQQIPVIKIGRLLRFSRSQLDSWIMANSKNAEGGIK